jgi:hypothetical protein
MEISIENLAISSDLQSITVLTPTPFSGLSLEQIMAARIEVEFVRPIINTAGIPYTITTSNFSLDDEKFV